MKLEGRGMCQVCSWSGYDQSTQCTRMKFSKNKNKCAFLHCSYPLLYINIYYSKISTSAPPSIPLPFPSFSPTHRPPSPSSLKRWQGTLTCGKSKALPPPSRPKLQKRILQCFEIIALKDCIYLYFYEDSRILLDSEL